MTSGTGSLKGGSGYIQRILSGLFKFEMPLSHPSRDFKLTVGHMGLILRKSKKISLTPNAILRLMTIKFKFSGVTKEAKIE